MYKAGYHLPVGEMLSRVAAGGHCPVGRTMIGLVLGNDLIAFGIQAGNFDGIFHRLCTAKGKERFGKIARGNFRDLFSKQPPCFGYHAGIYITHLLHLPRNGFGYPLIAVPDVYIHQLRGKVNVSFSIGAPQVHAFCFYHINGVQPGLFAPGE